jgi:hypothetical protein
MGNDKPMFRVKFDNHIQKEEEAQEEEKEAQEPRAGPSKRRKV